MQDTVHFTLYIHACAKAKGVTRVKVTERYRVVNNDRVTEQFRFAI